MAIEAIIKKWGNSAGIIFPKEFIEEKSLKINDKVIVEVVKEADLSNVFGSLKRKLKGQEFKDLVRKEWN